MRQTSWGGSELGRTRVCVTAFLYRKFWTWIWKVYVCVCVCVLHPQVAVGASKIKSCEYVAKQIWSSGWLVDLDCKSLLSVNSDPSSYHDDQPYLRCLHRHGFGLQCWPHGHHARQQVFPWDGKEIRIGPLRCWVARKEVHKWQLLLSNDSQPSIDLQLWQSW